MRPARGRQLLPVVREVVGAEAPFEKGAGIDAGRRVRLEEDQVAELPSVSSRARKKWLKPTSNRSAADA